MNRLNNAPETETNCTSTAIGNSNDFCWFARYRRASVLVDYWGINIYGENCNVTCIDRVD